MHFSEHGAVYQAVMTLYGRIQKQFSSIWLSFLPDGQHHGKYFALCVEPGMCVIMGRLQRFEIKAFDLVVGFHGADKRTIAYGFELSDAGFIQAFEAQGFAVAAAIGDPDAAVFP